MVERIKISTTNFICKDASGNVTFDATRKYLKTTATGQGTVKLGGYRNCPIVLKRQSYYNQVNLAQYLTYPDVGGFPCHQYASAEQYSGGGRAFLAINANGAPASPMTFRFPIGLTHVYYSSWQELTNPSNRALYAPYSGSTRVYGTATITGSTSTFPVSIYVRNMNEYFTGIHYGPNPCVAVLEDLTNLPLGEGVTATCYALNLNSYNWKRTTNNYDATNYIRTYSRGGEWYDYKPMYLSGPPKDFDLTVTS